MLTVLGPNGSGKSTLLRILAGLMLPSEGVVNRPPGSVRETTGYTALDQAVYPGLTGAEHLVSVGRTRKLADPKLGLLDELGLAAAKDQIASQYSTGMRGRLKLALAIQAQPQVLILDEPTASLDDSGRALVDEVIARQRQRGAVILATNDPADRKWSTLELTLNG